MFPNSEVGAGLQDDEVCMCLGWVGDHAEAQVPEYECDLHGTFASLHNHSVSLGCWDRALLQSPGVSLGGGVA